MIVVLMGVSGSGKTTIGTAMAERDRLLVCRRGRLPFGGEQAEDGRGASAER